ncbi:dTMP kinase [Maridesulfovibrio hydrothermalis]|uniref:Thymidylate kinase n=1 Tax=Maridesulfovibrio hydrothermalis AM13 = DSM 14728 TaxID=1121451 RepID=L0RCW2_9BACT|nr:dTMP kinase [Maridesulfovibrio hydrothermalis]CCO24623.1 Thymidylate kinase [Maridesulfovibrio hydrothermalis AM13 = DSM 14728]
MFITFEGIEGTGKTTQIKLLKAFLEESGHTVDVTLEPGGSRIGRELRKILLNMESTDITGECELFLYLADRAQHVSQVIRPAVEAGKIVISDRFADSTIVYQGYGRGLDPKLLRSLNDVAVGSHWPDLTILLDIEPEVGLKRAMTRNLQENKMQEEGRFEAESLEFHNRIREGYLTWAALNHERIIVVNADQSPEKVSAEINSKITKILKKHG